MTSELEKYAEALATVAIADPKFNEKVKALVSLICDDLTYNLASEIRIELEKSLGINFPESDEGETNHFEFGMALEGDLQLAILRRIHKAIGEY